MEGRALTAEKILPIVVAGIYLTTGVLHFRKGEVPAGVMWTCYCVANVATVLALSGAGK